MPTDAPLCCVCDLKPVHADGRCYTDYVYRRRHGHDAPIAVVIQRGHGRAYKRRGPRLGAA